MKQRETEAVRTERILWGVDLRDFNHTQVESSHAIDAVRFEVLDNHGNQAFTCLYHLRMYGDLL